MVFDPAELADLGRDWTRYYPVRALAAIFPKNIEDISKILKFCNEQEIEVVPSGGRTGLSAGAVATRGELILSLSKMNRILAWDSGAQCVDVEAGVIHEALQNFLEAKGFHWPIDLASKGSCEIGGNLATNAGGLRVIRYGHARRWVQSITVVTAAGDIMELNGPLEKNNAGICLRDLFIGSEGTLGVIARARLKVIPLVKNKVTILAPVKSIAEGLATLRSFREKHLSLLAFEFFKKDCLERVLQKTGLKAPFNRQHPAYVLMDIEVASLAELPEDLGLNDDSIAVDQVEGSRKLWAYRENITESLAHLGFVYKHDLAFPLANLESFLQNFEADFPTRFPGAELYVFGHLGDGNIHLNIVYPRKDLDGALLKHCADQNDWLFGEVKKQQGSISAEHGLGLIKQRYLKMFRSDSEIQILKAIKKAFDPKALLNPGKGV